MPFSFAYTELGAGTGALILFGTAQVTMIGAALRSGERPHAFQWLGLSTAAAGLVLLVLPGLTAPPPGAAGLMALSGCCWGIYSLGGRGSTNPIAENTGNFVRLVPLVAAASLLMLDRVHVERQGAWLAVASGSIASGLGYVVWYSALGGLTAVRASIVQLAVPVLAAFGGVIALAEHVSMRLIVAAVLILGGIGLALRTGDRHPRAS